MGFKAIIYYNFCDFFYAVLNPIFSIQQRTGRRYLDNLDEYSFLEIRSEFLVSTIGLEAVSDVGHNLKKRSSIDKIITI